MSTTEISRRDSLPFPRAVSGFAGREPEIARVRELLPREPLFLVYGVAGIGKSEFVYKVVEEARALPFLRRALTVAVSAREGLRCEHLLSILRARLGAAAEPPDSLVDDLNAVAKALEARPALVFLDDIHKLDAEPLGEMLGYLARHVSRSRIFAASRLEILLPVDTPPPVVCRLHPLSREAAAALLANLSHTLGLSAPDPAPVFARTGGSPFYILRELSDLRYAPRRGDDSLAAALRDLDAPLRHTLLVAHLLRGRLSPADLRDGEALWELSRRFLIDVDRGVILVHDLIGEALSREVSPDDLKAARRAAARLLLRRAEAAPADRAADLAMDVVEAARHLAAAGDPEEAWEAIERRRLPPARAALGPLALPILQALRPALPARSREIALRMALLLVRQARVTEAGALLDELSAADPAIARATRFLRLAAAIARRTGALYRAAALLEEALAAAENPHERLAAAMELATVRTLLGLGDVEGAQAAADRTAQQMSDAGLLSLKPYGVVLKARVHAAALRLREAEAALALLLEGSTGASLLRVHAEAQAESLRALVHGLLGDAEAARVSLARAAVLIQQTGTEAWRRELDVAAAEVRLLCGDTAGARATAEAAQAYYEARGRRYPQARAALVRAAALVADAAEPARGLLDEEGRDTAAILSEAAAQLAAAYELAERYGYALAWAPLVAAALYRRQGDERRARSELRAALRLADAGSDANEVGVSSGLAVLMRVLGLLPRALPGMAAQGAPHALSGATDGATGGATGGAGASGAEGEAGTGGRAESAYDLVVCLRRNVIRAPASGQNVAGRPLLCALLAHLASDHSVCSAERLFYDVWMGREYHPLRHRNAIYVAITRLRRVLQELLPGREVIETTQQGWRLAPDVSLCVLKDDSRSARSAAAPDVLLP